ncbi:MAG: ABC transporter ATP-binding protein [Dermatophilaceae bacterium]
MSGLRLEGLTKWFGAVRAVDRVDLAMAPGKYVCVLGPSGCGKTTLLRLVGGFERPDAGRVLLDGVDLTDRRPDERPVNTVFQSYALFPHLDVLGNVAFGPRRRGVRRPAAERRAREILELVELAGLARRKPSQLSGGEAQRVALARALAGEPAVLLLDEPLGALDARLRQTMQVGLKGLQARLGTTFLHVTHDQKEAMALADEIVVMCDGRVEQRGAPRDVYELPVSAFVARFVGDAVLLRATVAGRSGPEAGSRVLARAAGHILAVPPGRTPAVRDGAPVWVGVRPERVRVVPLTGADHDRPASHSDRNVVARGRVTGVVFTGPATGVRVAVPGLDEVTVLTDHASATCAYRPGDEVALTFDVADTFAVPRGEE